MKTFQQFLLEKAGALSPTRLLAKGASKPATPGRLSPKNLAVKQVSPFVKFAPSVPEVIPSPLK
jgi:hypothetical protein